MYALSLKLLPIVQPAICLNEPSRTSRMIIRRRHTKNFTVIPNAIHEDDRLSLEARGLLEFLLSRPPNWESRHDALRRKFHLSRQRLDILLKQLMAAAGKS